MLTANLPRESKVVVVMDNAKYHCRFIKIGIKEEEKFRIMDDILDNEIEPFVIYLSENGDSNDSLDEM